MKRIKKRRFAAMNMYFMVVLTTIGIIKFSNIAHAQSLEEIDNCQAQGGGDCTFDLLRKIVTSNMPAPPVVCNGSAALNATTGELLGGLPSNEICTQAIAHRRKGAIFDGARIRSTFTNRDYGFPMDLSWALRILENSKYSLVCVENNGMGASEMVNVRTDAVGARFSALQDCAAALDEL